MRQTAILEKRQTTIPQEVCEAAGLELGDKVEWRFEDGEIRGRKLVAAPEPKRITARLVRRGDELVFEAPPGIKIEPEAIAQAVREELESR
jgi:bifunctional DNA-binding transcriptional regulator/antitoxin component of YhaV-PrlF toxin-antitoxin module